MSNSTDPRDFVYAFLGIAVNAAGQGLRIVPDYNKSVQDVLVDFIKKSNFSDIELASSGTETEDAKLYGRPRIEFPTQLAKWTWEEGSRYRDFIRHLAAKLEIHNWMQFLEDYAPEACPPTRPQPPVLVEWPWPHSLEIPDRPKVPDAMQERILRGDFYMD